MLTLFLSPDPGLGSGHHEDEIEVMFEYVKRLQWVADLDDSTELSTDQVNGTHRVWDIWCWNHAMRHRA